MGDLGKVVVRHNSRARRYSLRIVDGKVNATIPARGTERELLSFINEKRVSLLKMIEKAPGRELLDENAKFQSQTFSLKITRTSLENFYVKLKDDILQISCPVQTVFSEQHTQKILWQIIEDSLRYEAKRILPIRLRDLAEKHGFSYAMIKINKSRSHWGSCTGQKNINISLSVMLLPEHLSDYILLHELCHTVEMNHSERFWKLMDKVTDGKALQYRNELKTHIML